MWDKKPDKIKRLNCMQSVELGGLGLPHLDTYLKALKIIWIRKLLNIDSKLKWKLILNKYFLFANSNNLKDYGGTYHLNDYPNPFWNEVFLAYENFWDKTTVDKIEDFLAEPLFLNSKFKIDNKSILWNKLYEINIKQVKDLLDENMNFLTHEQFQRKFDVEVSFISYFGTISAIKSYMRKKNIHLLIEEEIQPEQIPIALRIINKNSRGAKEIYQALLDKPKKSNALKNWEKLFTEGIPWVKIFFKVKKIKEIKIKWFQLRINYRILVTNNTLKEMGLRQYNHCSFCHNEKDTIKHYLWDCPLVQIFWQQLEQLLRDKCQNCVRLRFNSMLVLFGQDDKTVTDEGFDFIILHAKYYVYKYHIKEQLPTINGFIEYLKYTYKVDKYMYSIDMSNEKFIKKWASYEPMMM